MPMYIEARTRTLSVFDTRTPSPPAPLPPGERGERGRPAPISPLPWGERARVRGTRPGFTLVEMLVATALVMFIMLILSEAFVAGLEAFRTLKGIGDMEERLRAATLVIRTDLQADHFEPGRRLSDPN